VETTVPPVLTSQGGSSAQNTVWPLYGLPVGYTPPGYIPAEVQQATQNTQAPQNQFEVLNAHTKVPPVQPGFTSQQENLDDPRNAYQGPDLLDDVSKVNAAVPQLEEAQQKFKAIEDRLRMVEGSNDPIDLANIRKMASFANDDKLMMHCFQDGLTGVSLNWYIQLEGSHIRSWRDLANDFIKQYQYNIDMAPDRTQLQNMSQKEGELFKVYAQRWREVAAQV
ncbi:gag-protease polyprotein, partial [Trifolium medium]|nr:gag-protease polyprotein [Trifolium medium]